VLRIMRIRVLAVHQERGHFEGKRLLLQIFEAANGLRTKSGFKMHIPRKKLGIIFDVFRLINREDVPILGHPASRIIGVYCHYWLTVG